MKKQFFIHNPTYLPLPRGEIRRGTYLKPPLHPFLVKRGAYS
jgi:hypothetical protein